MSHDRTHALRYLAVIAVFCTVCVIYLGRLFYIQISGRESSYSTGTETRTVSIQAVRGEIYDRNGVKLVENRYTYTLSVAHTQFYTLSVREKNEMCLQLLTALKACGAEQKDADRFFPLERQYPYYRYNEDACDDDSLIYSRLQRVFKDLGLEKDTTAEELRDFYVETYDLLMQDSSGRRLYDDDEIDALIRLYYDMDARRFQSNGEYTVLEDASLDLITYIKERNLPSLRFTVDVERVYLYPGYASHILGTIGPIYQEEWEYYNEKGYQMNAVVGKDGCEAAFEEYLHGMDGTMKVETDANGTIVGTEMIKEPVAGKDVYLTIDITLQIAAEDGLAENVEYVVSHSTGSANGSGCNAGAAVVMDPDTFEVLAIASYPTYDLMTYHEQYTLLAKDEAKPLFNRALNGSYAPGSTFKLGMAAVGLMEGTITPSEVIDCVGKYPEKLSTGSVGCSTYGTNHFGGQTVIEAIAHSCNSFFCWLGEKLGIEIIEDYMSRFGFGQSTGFELGGTSGILAGPTYRGEIQSEEPWTPGNTWHASIGQSDHQASPLQLACYMGTLTNGGTRYTAHLLHSVYAFGSSEPSEVYEQSEDTVLDQTEIPDDVLATVFEGMRDVVKESRTIREWINSSNIPVTVGGKTGTAQTGADCDNALFVCAAPYDDPEIVISVVLEQGYSGGYAALTAARILEAYYASIED